MDPGEKKKDPTVDPDVPLDGIIIANLLAIYLRSEPERQPYKTPDFRLIELCKVANKNVRTDADIMEATGAVFIISMHFLMCPMLSDSLVFMECVNLLQTVQMESLVVLQKHGRHSIDFIHPTPSLEIENVELFYSFTDGIENCRELLREITRAIRVARDKTSSKTEKTKKTFKSGLGGSKEEPASSRKKEPPTDCYQAMSLYLFTSMAVAHICVVLKNTSEPYVVPGIMESVAMMAYFVPKIIPVKVEDDDVGSILNPNVKKHKLQSEITTEKRYLDYMKTVSKIGYAVMFTVFTERNLKELFMVRSRLMNGLSHPDISFSRLKSVDTVEFITSKEVELHHNKQLDIYMEPPRVSIDTMLDAGFAIHRDYLVNPIIKDESSNDQFKKLENSLVDKKYKKTKSIIPLIVPLDTNEVDLYWNKMSKHLRQAYLVFRPLRKPESSRHYFPLSYTPEFTDAKLKPSKRNVTLAEIECHYYYVDRFYCPRHCNPSYTPYWFGYQIIEFLFHKTLSGDGFQRSDGSRARDIKLQVDIIAKKRLSNNKNSSSTIKLTPIKIKEKPQTANKISLIDQLAAKSRPTTSVDSFSDKNSTSNTTKKIPGSLTGSRSSTPLVSNANTPRGSKIPSSNSSLNADPFDLSFPTLPTKSPIKVAPPLQKSDLLGRLNLAKEEAVLEVKLNEIELRMRSKRKENNKDVKLRSVDKTLQKGVTLVRRAKKTNREILLASNVLSTASLSDLDSIKTESSVFHSEAPSDDDEIEAKDAVKKDFMNMNSKPSSRYGSKAGSKAGSRMTTSITGMSREESLVESQGSILLRDIGQFRSELKIGGVVPSSYVAPVDMKVSNVWSSKPIIPKGNDPNALFGQTKNGFNGKTLEEANKEYAAEILKFQKERKEDQEREYTALQDLQEQEVGISRAHRLNKIRESREERKNAIVVTAKMRQFQEDSDKNDKKALKAEKKAYDKFVEEIKEKEMDRFMEISAWHSHELYKEQEVIQVRQEIELQRLKNMADKKESKEIEQRYREESRMKYLEERQRELENRKQKEIDEKYAILVAKRNLTKESRDRLTAKLRMGRFKYSDGKMGFYNDVRPEPIPWTGINQSMYISILSLYTNITIIIL
jgi:hypothetical protein